MTHTPLSSCCNAPVNLESNMAVEHYVCSRCRKPCDAVQNGHETAKTRLETDSEPRNRDSKGQSEPAPPTEHGVEGKEEMKEKIENTDALFYGELEYELDKYLPKFFSVEVRDVGFDENNPMNNLEFWFTVSWLVRMNFLEYGTSPRGAWLTEKGKEFRKYVLSTENPITKIIYGE